MEIFDADYQNSTTTITNDDDNQQTTTTTPDDDPSPSLSFWEKVHLVQALTGMSRVEAILAVAQSQNDVADDMEVELGGEFKVAFQYYLQQQQKQQQLQQSQRRGPVWFVLGDRPFSLTRRRYEQSFSWLRKLRFLMAFIWNIICPEDTDELEEEMQNVVESDGTDDLTEIFQQLIFAEILVDERDAYMACKLCQTCQYFITNAQQQQTIIMNLSKVPQRPSLSFRSPTTIDKNITVVAIVGAGHVQGMVEWFTNWNGQLPEQILPALVETKKKRRWWRWWTNRRRGMKAKLDQQDYHDEQQTRDLIESVSILPSVIPNRL